MKHRCARFALAFAAMIAAPAALAAPTSVVVKGEQVPNERLLVMTGEGEVKAMPDTAVVKGGVITRARRPADALRANAEAMEKAVAALKAMGFADKDIATASVQFEPQYERDRNGQINFAAGIVAYSVTNTIAVTLNDKIERAGEVFDTLVQSGANYSTSISFKVRNIDALENQARAEAAKNALARAALYAKALGLELGAIKLVREGAGYGDTIIASGDIGRFPDSDTAEALQRIPGVPISRVSPGEQTIRRSVTVTWTLK